MGNCRVDGLVMEISVLKSERRKKSSPPQFFFGRGHRSTTKRPQSYPQSIMATSQLSRKRKLESNRKAAGENEDWDAEQDYELRPRKVARESSKLPLKKDKQVIAQEVEEVSDVGDNDSSLGDSEDGMLEGEGAAGEEDAEAALPAREQILKAKEELARLAALVNEDPEEHISSLKAFAQIYMSTRNVTVKQLTLATQAAVFKDIIPGYRIRPAAEDELKEKLSKDVKKLRDYEQSMVGAYKGYIRALEMCAKDKQAGTLRSTALSCASTLLLAAPHFNFRTELIKIVMAPLRRRETDNDYERSIQTLEKLFQEDDDGRSSLEVVSLLAKMMRARNYNFHESLLNLFLSLRILSEFSGKGSYDGIDREETRQIKKMKRKQEKKTFKSKKERKLNKERRVIEKEFREADAVVGHEERDKMQAEMLKLVFATYFRILKAKIPNLMGAVLEGLAKHAHLINQDFFGDILEALKDIIRDIADEEELYEDEDEAPSERDGIREALLCVVTAFALLQGQDGKTAINNLHLDLNFFVSFLYRNLIPAMMDPDVERSSKSLRLDDPTDTDESSKSRPNVNIKTKTVLLIRSLSAVLLPTTMSRTSVPPLRLAAFTKQLMTASLQLPEKSCQAALGLLAQTTSVHGRKIASLWSTEERKGDGVFDGLRAEVETSNPFAATVWESELLRKHYSPKVREAVGVVHKNVRSVL
jgi:nucleolar complex protein 3